MQKISKEVAIKAIQDFNRKDDNSECECDENKNETQDNDGK